MRTSRATKSDLASTTTPPFPGWSGAANSRVMPRRRRHDDRVVVVVGDDGDDDDDDVIEHGGVLKVWRIFAVEPDDGLEIGEKAWTDTIDAERARVTARAVIAIIAMPPPRRVGWHWVTAILLLAAIVVVV